ncbi:hypothetical protein LTR35_012663 [Friedmanniomyces endolithicus]|uniref:N-acetyltransferase domain-containing protein n=1 Tax=Friedmanniomyces endolithicus TaxID=329885 RepID=A0AAN6JB66_9PEZI|nr:hypothetical protein LTR35_012663 [Friedmanniomyces endolithicus]KAK0288613.1 hypothetical protein LTS00_009546 [Friedmanniomyces endolithicus]KAK0323641.1 hypothetical protein LTR82_005388 [Friedmanniomyces endolithicus]KAK1006371.1 hypothetical protein LTR54_006895 [Friedmanniomyces endolithicus]
MDASKPTMLPTVDVRRLPRLPKGPGEDPSAITLATKYRDLRLHALHTSPEAFASSFEIESQWGLGRTVARLSNPQAAHFIATLADRDTSGTSNNNDETALQSQQWVGFIALLGPTLSKSESSAKVSAAHDPFAQMQATGLSNNLVRTSEQATTSRPPQSGMLSYHIGAVFVERGMRKAGVGRALIDAALSEAETQVHERKASAFECTMHVDTYNDAAIRLYQKVGFEVVGEETYAQQTVASGPGESRVIERVAFLMEMTRARITCVFILTPQNSWHERPKFVRTSIYFLSTTNHRKSRTNTSSHE